MNIYTDNVETKEYPTLSSDIKCDIAVIGGGITGILTAYFLAQSGQNVTLFERDKIGLGNTANSTGNVSAIQEFMYQDIATKYSVDTARLHYNAQSGAIDDYEDLINKHNIECDFSRVSTKLFTYNDFDLLMKEYELLKNFGAKPEIFDGMENLHMEGKGLNIQGQAIFNPYAFVLGLPKNFTIFENTPILKWDLSKKILYSNEYAVTCNKIIFATSFPLPRLKGMFALKMYKSNSYVLALSGAPKLGYIYNDNLESGLFMRDFGDYLLFNGLDHRTGRAPITPPLSKLESISKELFPDSSVACKWCYNDCTTFDKMPIVDTLTPNSSDIYTITGFNRWGLASAMTSAKIITDCINGVSNPYAKLYSLTRGYVSRNMGDYAKNGLVNMKHITTGILHLPMSSYRKMEKNTGKITWYKGNKRAVYRDNDGKYHVTHAYCTHLGCELSWNADALSWDCPCHGSRYDIDGKILTAPSTKHTLL